MRSQSWILISIVAFSVVLGAQTGNAQESGSDAGLTTAAAPMPAQANDQSASSTCPCDECDTCCCSDWYAYGDFLYLRPRNAGVEYAVPINGPISSGSVPLQVGPTAVVDPEFAAGFRVGIGKSLSECSSISADYTYYRNSADDSISIGDPPYPLRSMVFHPSSFDAAADWLSATAHESIDFDMADVTYRHDIVSNECCSLNYLVGFRYASLRQQFQSTFENIISESADAGVNFDGFGLRVGLEGQSHHGKGFFFYGKTDAAFLGGEFRGSYLQSSANDPVIAETTWDEARFVTMLDGEVGAGWMSAGGHLSLSIGYMLNGWLNVVKPTDFITSVQANQYNGPNAMGNTALVFDGFVARAQYVW